MLSLIKIYAACLLIDLETTMDMFYGKNSSKGDNPVRKGPAGIQVNLNTWNLKKILVDFFLPHMRWNTGGKLYKVTK